MKIIGIIALLIAVLALLIAVLAAIGFLGIWILNTLFPVLAIKYGVYEVTAMALFIMMFASKDTVKIRK